MSNSPVYAAPPSREAWRSGEDRARTFSIGDLARDFGISLRTLRFYEDRGLISPRRVGATRVYTEHDRERLTVILKGKHLGFTLTEIRALLERDGQGDGTTAKLQLSAKQIDDQIAHLEAQKQEIEAALEELREQRKRARPS